jgi:hypothetical protein
MKQFVLAWVCVGVLILLGAFGGVEVPATLLGIVGAVVLIARLQGKGEWAIGNVAQDLRGAMVRVLSHLLLPQRVLDRRRGILALMALAGLTAIIFPPFMSEIDNRLYRQAEFDGYAFLFKPPSETNRYESVHIDYGRLGLEFVAIFLTGGLVLLLLGSQARRLAETSPADEAVGELLQSVVAGFRGIAKKRGESLSDAELKRICAFFQHQQQTYGLEFTREHLDYELAKYEREGLRADYRVQTNSLA